MANVVAVRAWKRDNSRNVMAVERAAANLGGNGTPGTEADITARLLAGETIETPLAVFYVPGTGNA